MFRLTWKSHVKCNSYNKIYMVPFLVLRCNLKYINILCIFTSYYVLFPQRFRYSGMTIDFETDDSCNIGVDHLYGNPLHYTLDAQPGKTETYPNSFQFNCVFALETHVYNN